MKGKVVGSNSKLIGCACNLLIKRKKNKNNSEVVGSKLTRFMNNLSKKKSLIALLELDGLKSITMGGIRFIY